MARDSWNFQKDCCLYTIMMGGYERLNEQPVAAQSGLPFICLTDDPELRSDTWTIRMVEPVFPRDPIRSQRDLKIRPHLHLPGFARSVYIDNTVILKEPPERLLELVEPESGFLLPAHSFRETVLDEFLEVSRQGLDDGTRIFEQLHHYMLSCPEVLQELPWWTAIMVRDHRSARVRAMLETWALHVMRYSRRDQLSVNAAFRAAGLQPTTLPIADNFGSDLHRWPNAEGRDRQRGARNLAVSMMPIGALVRQLEQQQTGSAIAAASREQEATALRADVARLAAALAERDRKIADIAREAERAEAAQTAAHRGEAETLRGEVRALREEARRTAAALTALSAQQQAMLGSTTWRIMEPLRRLGRHTPTSVRKAARRGAKLLWWAATAQLGRRLAERRGRTTPASSPSPASVRIIDVR